MGYGRSRRMIGVMALAAVVAVIVAACGSDKEIPPTRTPSIPGTASATTAPSATATQAPRPTATSASAPTATQAPQPTATSAPAPIGDSSAGRNVFLTVGCADCHTIDGLDGATGAIGPNLTTVGNRAGSRRSHRARRLAGNLTVLCLLHAAPDQPQLGGEWKLRKIDARGVVGVVDVRL